MPTCGCVEDGIITITYNHEENNLEAKLQSQNDHQTKIKIKG